MWSIVAFEGTDQVQGMPQKWISSCQKLCIWPADASASSLRDLIRYCKDIPAAFKTNRYQIRVMGSTDNYEKMLQMAARAEASSDLNSDEPNGRRKRKPNRKYICSDSEDEVPTPHKKTSHHSSSQSLLKPAVRVSSSSSDSSDEANVNEFNVTPQKDTVSCNSRSDLEAIRRDFSDFKRECRTQWEKVLTSLENLREENKVLRSRQNPAVVTTPSKLPQLPVGTLEELKLLEKVLEDPTEATRLEQAFVRVGGSNAAKIINNVMSYLMKKEVSCQFSRYGQKGKLSFTKLKCYTAVINAVSKSVGANETTLHKINIQIGAFLANKTSRMQEKTVSGFIADQFKHPSGSNMGESTFTSGGPTPSVTHVPKEVRENADSVDMFAAYAQQMF